MKKINLILLLLFVSINHLFSFGNNCEFDKNLQPLKNYENLDWEYDSNESILRIYKISNTEKELYDSIDYLDWSNWEVSKDRKKIIYWGSWNNFESNELPDYYLLDGNIGKTVYLGKLQEGLTSSDFNYLIYKDSSVEPKVKFILYNIKTHTNEKEIFWNLKSEKYFLQEENTAYILRSDNPEYDFHIFIVGMRSHIFAEGYLSIKQNRIITVVDDEDENRIFELSSFSKFELGK